MTTKTRTDAHRASALIPADYSWVGYTDDGDDAFNLHLTDGPLFTDEGREWSNPSGVRNAIHPGGCDACGQRGLRYRHYFRHDPTGDVIVLGDQCVNRMDFDSAEAYAAARRVKGQREREEQEAAANKWKAANPEVAEAIETYAEDHYILADMAAKLSRYGSLSEKQSAFALRLAEETKERLAEKAEQEAAKRPIPEEIKGKRVELTGRVLTTKWQENAYGGSLKMLLLEERGFKLWGTVPSALNAGKGDDVTFTAEVEASEDDEAFGFFSRPTKPRNLTVEAEEAEVAC